MKIDFKSLNFNAHGTIKAVVQDAGTGEVLALVSLDGTAVAKTSETGSLWLYDAQTAKVYDAADDGAPMKVVEISTDKNGSALLIKAEPQRAGLGVFTNPVWLKEGVNLPVPEPDGIHGVLAELYRIICYKRNFGDDKSFTRYLFMSGQDKILQQLGTDTTSTVIASKNADKTQVLDEMSGLWYHCLVLLAYHDINPAELLATMGDKRAK